MKEFVDGVTINGESVDNKPVGITYRELRNTPIIDVRNVRVTSRVPRKGRCGRVVHKNIFLEQWARDFYER